VSDPSEVDKLEFKFANIKHIKSASELAGLSDDDYALPISKIFETIDSARQPRSLFQMTVSPPENKHLKLKGFNEIKKSNERPEATPHIHDRAALCL
jgi:hypothetical protein